MVDGLRCGDNLSGLKTLQFTKAEPRPGTGTLVQRENITSHLLEESTMLKKQFLFAVLLSVVCCPLANAQVFFTETFDYPDGDLLTVSNGLWPTHSPEKGGGEGEIQVVNGEAVITTPGSFDHNRLTGVIAGAADIWYYAVRFRVELGEGQSINNEYFIHFKDNSVFGFNARLALDDPANVENDYSLSVWASSEGDGQADWDGDFAFGETLTCVMCWNNGTGEATLWVNPVDQNSTSITDTEAPDSMRAVESVALRQDGGSSSVVTVDALSAGTDFDAVLAELGGDDVLVGDVNCDGEINLLDVAPFVDLISTGGFSAKADINGDGTVDLLDVTPFVDLLAG